MTTITTAPQVSWTSAHRALLAVIGALLAVAVAATLAVLLMGGGEAAPERAGTGVLAPGASDVPACNVVRGPC